eukprot:361865-Chlamydomonas_euryale.AAC.3
MCENVRVRTYVCGATRQLRSIEQVEAKRMRASTKSWIQLRSTPGPHQLSHPTCWPCTHDNGLLASVQPRCRCCAGTVRTAKIVDGCQRGSRGGIKSDKVCFELIITKSWLVIQLTVVE